MTAAPPQLPPSTIKVIAASIVVAAFFLFFAEPGLRTWFTDDQLMNLYLASAKPLGELALQPDRPVSSLAMRGLWALFGFDPLPYRIVCFALLLLNLALATGLAWKISGSGVTALLFAIPFAFHASLTDLYLSTATLYDILCFTFTFAALLWYAAIRAASRAPRWHELAGIGLLCVLAVGSKEMAITLPLLLALVEWLLGDRRRWLVPLLSAAVCAAFLGHFLIHSYMQSNTDYRPVITPKVFWANWQHYLSRLFYQIPLISPLTAKLTLAGCLVLPAVLRRREAWFASAVALLTPLPIIFILPRNLYAFYIPYFGFCLLAASALSILAIRKWVPGALTVALAVWLIPQHLAMRGWANGWYYEQEKILRQPGETLRRSLPPLPPNSSVLFVDDPFPAPPEMEHQLFYYVCLIANNPAITVRRAKNMSEPTSEANWTDYTAVFRLTRDELVRLR
jgi:hypothetical protein